MNSEPIQPPCRFHWHRPNLGRGGELCGQREKFADVVYVLHAFSKKTRRTSKQDIDLASDRFRAVIEERERQKR